MNREHRPPILPAGLVELEGRLSPRAARELREQWSTRRPRPLFEPRRFSLGEFALRTWPWLFWLVVAVGVWRCALHAGEQ